MQVKLVTMRTLKILYSLTLLIAFALSIYIRYNYAPGSALFLTIPIIGTILMLLIITTLTWVREKSLSNSKLEWFMFGVVILILTVLAKFF